MTTQSNDSVSWGGRLSESAKDSEGPFIALLVFLLFFLTATMLTLSYLFNPPPPAPAQVAQPPKPPSNEAPQPQPQPPPQPPQEAQAPEPPNNEALFREFQWYRKGLEAKR